MKPKRPYFERFKCYLCKGRASFMEYCKGKSYYLCNKKECQTKHDRIVGFHSVLIYVRKESEE